MIDPSVVETIEKANVGRWSYGGRSANMSGHVVFNAPSHMDFMQVVVRFDGDKEDDQQCVERLRTLEALFKHTDELIASYKRMKELEAALHDLYSTTPKDAVTQALLNAQKLL